MEYKSKQYKTQDVFLSLFKINVLPQIRKIFENIPSLAENIFEHGLINAVTVACLDYREMKKYIAHFSEIFKTHLDDSQFVLYQGQYCFLIAGERRLRATRLLIEQGRYDKEFRNRIKAVLCVGISAEEAIKLQISENVRDPVRPDEEALFITRCFRFYKRKDMSLAEFSRIMMKSPETIKQALRFTNVPRYIQTATENNVISFGVACELGRLRDHRIRGQELRDWFVSAVLQDYPVKKFQDLVRKHLRERDSQGDLINLFKLEDDKEFKKEHRKRIIDSKISEAFHYQSRYFLKVLYLFDQGFLGMDDSPFSLRGPLNSFQSLIVLLEERIIPHLQRVINDKKGMYIVAHGKEVVTTTHSLVSQVQVTL
ncbi:MAG: hypothetical protein WC099_00090 [Candidatus Paceibacterota bacterium]